MFLYFVDRIPTLKSLIQLSLYQNDSLKGYIFFFLQKIHLNTSEQMQKKKPKKLSPQKYVV